LNFLPSPKFGNENIDKFMFPNKNEKREKRTRSLRKCSINIESNIEILKNGKFENEFNPLKTIKIDKFSTIYKVEEIKTKKIFCAKKIVKTSPKSNIDNLKKITYDFKNNSNNVLSQFCVKILEFWIEKEEYNPLLSEFNYCDKNLYLLSNYYENGDIFDYIEQLELLAKDELFTFTENFYWDIIFEMMMGLLFVHECGYMHIDIQPTNFLVDENGYIKLNDFSLAIRVSELCVLDDIIEGDARYISKELFHFKKNTKINSKVDIFSLGLTILEIIAKIELPYNGNLWQELRNEFTISNKFFEKSNIKNVDEFISLISQMILPFEKRPTIKELINNFPQLSQRYNSLLNGNYKKSCTIPKIKNNSSKQLNLNSAPSQDIL
jgi:serine/threonine protein kinase